MYPCECFNESCILLGSGLVVLALTRCVCGLFARIKRRLDIGFRWPAKHLTIEVESIDLVRATEHCHVAFEVDLNGYPF